eukprot:298702-Chlamydomonas_euryale.AAC.7
MVVPVSLFDPLVTGSGCGRAGARDDSSFGAAGAFLRPPTQRLQLARTHSYGGIAEVVSDVASASETQQQATTHHMVQRAARPAAAAGGGGGLLSRRNSFLSSLETGLSSAGSLEAPL